MGKEKEEYYGYNIKLNCKKGGKRLSLHKSQVAHQAGAYPSFTSMKQLGVFFFFFFLGVFLLPPGWDASPSQGYPPALNLLDRESKVSYPRTQLNVPGQGSTPDHSLRSQAH